MGDVNGDQVADVAVASRQDGRYQVAIYSGTGQADASLTWLYADPLATIPNPSAVAAGPLDVALGDFTGGGISELAISAKYFEADLRLRRPSSRRWHRRWTARRR